MAKNLIISTSNDDVDNSSTRKLSEKESDLQSKKRFHCLKCGKQYTTAQILKRHDLAV